MVGWPRPSTTVAVRRAAVLQSRPVRCLAGERLTRDFARIGELIALLRRGRPRCLRLTARGIDPAEDDEISWVEARVAARVEDPDLWEPGPRRGVGALQRERPTGARRDRLEHDRVPGPRCRPGGQRPRRRRGGL